MGQRMRKWETLVFASGLTMVAQLYTVVAMAYRDGSARRNGGYWVCGVRGRTLVQIHGSQNPQWTQSAGRFLRVDPGGTGVIGKTTKIYGIYGLQDSVPAGLPEVQFLMLK